MSGDVPVWLLVVCLAVAVPAAFVAGYEWCGWARRRRLRRAARQARARLEQRRSVETVDATRFTG